MRFPRTIPAPLAALSALAVLSALLVGCSPEPDPTPTPTAAFASEEEAFAAAEETYRAYNDAGNARMAGDEDASPQDFLTGRAFEDHISTQNLLRERELSLEGTALVSRFDGTSVSSGESTLKLTTLVCIDATSTRVFNSEHEDVTPPERPNVSALDVTFVMVGDRLLISDSRLSEEQSC